MLKKQENSSEKKSTPKRGRPRKKAAEPKGLGDKVEEVLNSKLVAPVTNAIKKAIWKDGEDCGCDERKEKLNKLSGSIFRKARCLTESQHKILAEELPKIKGSLEYDSLSKLAKVHAGVFNYQFEGPCSSCGAKNQRIIDQLRVLFETYKSEL
jgi:hypothetical protein